MLRNVFAVLALAFAVISCGENPTGPRGEVIGMKMQVKVTYTVNNAYETHDISLYGPDWSGTANLVWGERVSLRCIDCPPKFVAYDAKGNPTTDPVLVSLEIRSEDGQGVEFREPPFKLGERGRLDAKEWKYPERGYSVRLSWYVTAWLET